MDDEIIKKMQARVARCRRLAKQTLDSEVAKILLQIADEGEADLKKLERERATGRDGHAPSV